MKLLAGFTITIETDINLAYSYISNMENFGQWFPEVLEIKSIDGVPHGTQGKLYKETVKSLGGGISEITLVVKESIPNKIFVTEGNLKPLLPRMEVRFSQNETSATTINWSFFSRNDSLLFKLLFLPLARSVMSRRARVGASRLKHNLSNGLLDKHEQQTEMS